MIHYKIKRACIPLKVVDTALISSECIGTTSNAHC